MDDTSKGEQSSNTFPSGLVFGVFVITAFVMIFFWWVYMFHVGTNISHNGKDWSDFGSYFGGVLGPLFSAASILFVWWQSHKTMASQQQQLVKLNQQLGLEKQIIFRSEFVRLLTRAIEQGETEFVAGDSYQENFKGELAKRETSYKKLSRKVEFDFLENADPRISYENLQIFWRILSPYLAYIFELADHLRRSNEFGVEQTELNRYIRQFNLEFYSVGSEAVLIEELLKKPDIHGYHDISGIFQNPESSS